MTVFDSVAGHYGRPGLEQEILAALEISQGTVDIDGLASVDEFHSGGRQATAALTAQLDLQPENHVLDVGSGIGGTARFIASTYGCRVTGIDLTEEFVETARALTDHVGLADRVTFRQASALELPFPAASFDAVCMLHVGMNIEDKDTLFAELARVLRPRGICGIYDVMRSGQGELSYPVPWANSPAISFLADLGTYRSCLTRAGLVVTSVRDWTDAVLEFGRAAQAGPSEQGRPWPGSDLLMGEDFSDKRTNVVNALRRGVIAPTEIIATRPSS
ncbi:MAG: class I SAM-dependent methyltransferase [Egibacteraceae bacterium]